MIYTLGYLHLPHLVLDFSDTTFCDIHLSDFLLADFAFVLEGTGNMVTQLCFILDLGVPATCPLSANLHDSNFSIPGFHPKIAFLEGNIRIMDTRDRWSLKMCCVVKACVASFQFLPLKICYMGCLLVQNDNSNIKWGSLSEVGTHEFTLPLNYKWLIWDLLPGQVLKKVSKKRKRGEWGERRNRKDSFWGNWGGQIKHLKTRPPPNVALQSSRVPLGISWSWGIWF